MEPQMRAAISAQVEELKVAGLYKAERELHSAQGARIRVAQGEVLNFCANNYLALASDPQIVQAAREALERWGFGMASVRFICGTQSIHRQLETRLTEFLGTEDTILYGSCFDANGGLFETLLDERDAVISDELNHASIIDGIRLCKAKRLRYRNGDLEDLERQLQQVRGSVRRVLIATDGVFSMDGYIAKLGELCAVAERYEALLMVDDSHGVGVLGDRGRGTHEHCGVLGRIDLLTGTLGKALGGACGGYTSGRCGAGAAAATARSRPYLFSNSLPPPVVGAALRVLELISQRSELRRRLWENAVGFRAQMRARGFEILPGEHPIVPVMMGEAASAVRLAASDCLRRGST